MTSENMLFTLVVMVLLWWLLNYRSMCEEYAIETRKPRRPWHLRPRTPKDCPECQCEDPQPHNLPDIIPWSQIKSKRGRRKELVSEGHACPNQICAYHGITDQQVHALVGDGVEGVHEPIQWWRCQACGARFSARRDTAMRWLKTPSWRVYCRMTLVYCRVTLRAALYRVHRGRSVTRNVKLLSTQFYSDQ